MRFKERFSAVASWSAEVARSAKQLAAEFVVDGVYPATKQFVAWSARGASSVAKSVGSAAWSATETLVTRVLPATMRFVGRFAKGASRASAGGASGAAKPMRSIARHAAQAVVAWFFPLWVLMGLMGDAFFNPKNLFPILMIVWVVTIGVIWLSRRGEQV